MHNSKLFAANPSSVTPITSADAGTTIVKVVSVINTGAASHSVVVKDVIDTTYVTVDNNYVYGLNVGYNTMSNADGTVARNVAANYAPYGTYSTATGNWQIGNVGSPGDPAQPNFGVQPYGPGSTSNNFLFVFLKVNAALTTTQTLTNTATMTQSLDFPANHTLVTTLTWQEPQQLPNQ